MRLRRLNQVGIDQFENFLDKLSKSGDAVLPMEILSSTETSETINPDIDLQQRPFTTRFELGQYLTQTLNFLTLKSLDSDRGLWAWLALFHFNAICPISKTGEKKPGSRARWILDSNNFQRYYRHLLAGPYKIAKFHQNNPAEAMCVLCSPPGRPGDMVEQLASRQEFATNRSVMGAVTRLYYDQINATIKKGALETNKNKPGSLRRFIDLMRQFDVTYDLYSLSTDGVIEILPKEFNKFLNS